LVIRKKKEGYEFIDEEEFDDDFEENDNEEKYSSIMGRKWLWTAVAPQSRLLISYRLGDRKLIDAKLMVSDVAKRLISKPVFTSDALKHYATALADVYHTEVEQPRTGKAGRPKKPLYIIDEDLNYAIVHKIRENGKVVKVEKRVIYGDYNVIMAMLSHSPSNTINTSYVERFNLDLRLWDAHLTRKSLTFAKAIDYLKAKLAICVAAYNLIRVHSSLGKDFDESSGKEVQVKMTPAMAAGVTKHIWTYSELLDNLY
jgi:IS1 family transposase